MAPRRRHLMPGRYPPDGRSPSEVAPLLRVTPVELAFGYDAAGRQRFRQVGDENGIRGFRHGDLQAIRRGLLIHNHPPYPFPVGDPRSRAGSFSPSDLMFMFEHDLSEMVAVTSDRTYVVRRRSEGFYLDPGQISEIYEETADRVRLRLTRLADEGMISVEEALAEGRLADDVMDEIGIFFDYTWTEAE